MTVTIRAYSSTDADRVAEFFNRNGYGPIQQGLALDGEALARSLEERATLEMKVAEEDGEIVGTLAFQAVSARKALPPGEVYAGLFLLAPTHRSGMTAGRLLGDSVLELVHRDVRIIHTEINPNNSAVLPIHQRIGFSRITDDPPDQYGRWSMVSYLPAILKQFYVIFPGEDLERKTGTTAWRSVASKHKVSDEQRRTDLANGVVRYHFQSGKHHIETTVDVRTGIIQEVSVNDKRRKIPADSVPAEWDYLKTWDDSHPESVRTVVPGVDARMDLTDGTLWLDVEGHLGPVLVDRFPAAGRAYSWTWREPVRQKVQVTEHHAGWTASLDLPGHRLVRDIAVTEEGVTVQTGLLPVGGKDDGQPAPERIYTLPKVLLRGAAYAAPDTSGHEFVLNLFGKFPRELMDYECFAPDDDAPRELSGARSYWTAPHSGITVRAEYFGLGAFRPEGGSLPGLVVARGSTAGYRVSVVRGPAAPLPKGYELSTTAGHPLPSARPVVLADRTASGRTLAHAEVADNEIDFGDDLGISSWTNHGSTVLDSPFPRAKGWRSLKGWAAGAWWFCQGPREDMEQGVEWGDRSSDSTIWNAGAAVHAARDDRIRWGVTNPGNTLRFEARSAPQTSDHELCLAVMPKVSGSGSVMLGVEHGTPWVLDRGVEDWEYSLNRVAVQLHDGRWLVVTANKAHQEEIFLRSTQQAVQLVLLSRVPEYTEGFAEWDLTVLDTEDEAGALMSH